MGDQLGLVAAPLVELAAVDGVEPAAQAEVHGDAFGEDVSGLQELVMYGLKGAAAYADHAQVLGAEDADVYGAFHEVMDFLAGDPTDVDALVANAMKAGDINYKAMELLSKPYGQVRPDWLDGAADYELPAWYDEYRVHLHTRLSPPWMDKPIFLTAAEAFRSVGVHTFVRHIKSGGEGAWWPSAVGAIYPGCEERNLAQEIIDDAHANGCRIIAYSRHMEDHQLFLDHPEWGMVEIEGHCDERGSDAHNLALGKRRAAAVERHLVDMGVPRSRIATHTFGSDRPAARGHGEGAWRRNRRAELRVQDSLASN